ncbi:hypothetical protein IW262DRAFT_214756 [Armillaria fumosa]|nr:hypothetical protein IW262DRAFT_214756 [Armillaria fumosa]
MNAFIPYIITGQCMWNVVIPVMNAKGKAKEFEAGDTLRAMLTRAYSVLELISFSSERSNLGLLGRIFEWQPCGYIISYHRSSRSRRGYFNGPGPTGTPIIGSLLGSLGLSFPLFSCALSTLQVVSRHLPLVSAGGLLVVYFGMMLRQTFVNVV